MPVRFKTVWFPEEPIQQKNSLCSATVYVRRIFWYEFQRSWMRIVSISRETGQNYILVLVFTSLLYEIFFQ